MTPASSCTTSSLSLRFHSKVNKSELTARCSVKGGQFFSYKNNTSFEHVDYSFPQTGTNLNVENLSLVSSYPAGKACPLTLILELSLKTSTETFCLTQREFKYPFSSLIELKVAEETQEPNKEPTHILVQVSNTHKRISKSRFSLQA